MLCFPFTAVHYDISGRACLKCIKTAYEKVREEEQVFWTTLDEKIKRKSRLVAHNLQNLLYAVLNLSLALVNHLNLLLLYAGAIILDRVIHCLFGKETVILGHVVLVYY